MSDQKTSQPKTTKVVRSSVINVRVEDDVRDRIDQLVDAKGASGRSAIVRQAIASYMERDFDCQREEAA